ncbi:uncharacterized protein APUU_20018S [Aspergillus puulaauensis]|uniref:Uncharacterized protein n=1 Tax=Aspergillus puulaauensis TaxID=1220207 RepID=A0A7R8AHZ6_9EURO|nr:uncharacterized protein APUU_20018S [Aspergillus puulaauensis]BCS19586.1 hypothetical protein APUU_20018S [Aspergillus puulaauensis]
MRLVILSHIVSVGLLVPPIQGAQPLVPAPTDTTVDPIVTEAPAFVHALEQRQFGEGFVAWWENSGSWRGKTCESGSAYNTWSTYGQCCTTADSSCNYATACAPDGRIQYYQGNASCDPGQSCEVFTILSSSGSPASDRQNIIQCISTEYDYPGTWYRQSYALTTDPSTTTVTQTETATVTQTVATDGSAGLQQTQTMQGLLGALIVAVLLAVY